MASAIAIAACAPAKAPVAPPPTTATASAEDNATQTPLRFLLINDVYFGDTLRDGTAGLSRVAALRDSLERSGPVEFVLAGDFNARPGSATYGRARAAGFDDAWTRAYPDGPPGLTCCHRLPLDDSADQLRSRIDFIFTRGDLEVTAASTVGDTPDAFAAGLWPSDHAGVVATIERREA